MPETQRGDVGCASGAGHDRGNSGQRCLYRGHPQDRAGEVRADDPDQHALLPLKPAVSAAGLHNQASHDML